MAVTVGLDIGLPRDWAVNIVGTYHTGWPTTEVTGEVVPDGEGGFDVIPVPGPRNGARHPSYRRLDLRAGRSFPLSSGALTLTVEILNVLDTENVCCIDDFEFTVDDDGTVATLPQRQFWAPIVPSVAVAYRF